MSDYRLYDVLKPKTKVSYASYAYNDPAFLKTNNDFEKKHFYWVDAQGDEAHAHIAFSIVDGIAYSPHKLPLGGLEVSEALSENDISDFLKAIEEAIDTLGIQSIRIHQAPNAYADQSRIAYALIDCEYQSIQERIFHTIAVDNSDLFDRMHKMEQRKIKKCIDAGAQFEEVKKDKKKVFKWIDRFRELDYKPPSMSWAELDNSNMLNPKMYRVFAVYMDEYLLAATVVVIVNREIVYHFMPASNKMFDYHKKYSAMVFLVSNLYKWCQDNSFKVLDLGTSYVDMKMKASLAKFKEHIGGEKTTAVSWEKKLNDKT